MTVVLVAVVCLTIGAAINQASRRLFALLVRPGPCWLCEDLGGIAVHELWSKRRGKALWTAHPNPTGDDHPVYPCPACGGRTTRRTPR